MKFAWLCSHESYQPEDLVKQAVAAEEAGFDVVLGSDHFHPWVDDTSAAGFVWSWLGAVAVQTDHVQLGTSVTCPLFHYHPALVAQMAATTDRLSDGRLLLGVGTGEALNERPLGFPVPRLHRAPEPHAGEPGDHAPHAGRGEGDVSRRALHDGDRQALLPAQGQR